MSQVPFIQSFPIQCDDSSAVFSIFAHQPWSFYLDSANASHENSRFDILVSEPLHKITAQDGQVFLDGQIQFKDLFSTINSTIKQSIKCDVNTSSLPFIGGAIGFFGYDVGKYIESLPAIAIDDINLPDSAVGIYNWAIIFDNKERILYLVDQSEKPQERFDKLSKQITNSIPASDSATSDPQFKIMSDWSSNMTKQDYAEKFEKVKQYITNGDCYQINLAQRFSAQYTGSQWQAYLHLRKANSAPFSAYLNLENESVLSISPERFLKLDEGHIQTKPIKGTMPRYLDPIKDKASAQALQQSTKDRAENVMIVDLLRNDISKVSTPGSVNVPKLFDIESFPAVHHLVSTVVGKLDSQYTAVDLLKNAFPGGSITGAPKIRAMEIIEELEPNRRSIYCGSIGYICSSGNMDTSITIRTLVGKNNTMYCWAGGGLVADSKVESEYQETYDKVNKILPTLSTLNACIEN